METSPMVSIIVTLKKLLINSPEETQSKENSPEETQYKGPLPEEPQSKEFSLDSDDYFWDMDDFMNVNYYKT